MLELIFSNLLFVSVGALLIIVVRSLPRIGELEVKKLGLVERLIVSEIPERVDVAINAFLFKTVRRMKVGVLKMDNTLTKHIERMKPEDVTKAKPDFTSLNGNGNGNNGHTNGNVHVTAPVAAERVQ
ncbi:MAG: hypothetical protein Q7S28_02285 [bacterium]|nr:hypothetical protein [bacterium]